MPRAYIWRTDRGQACGGIRLWQYHDMESYLRDGLRLALGMGAKSAVCLIGFGDVTQCQGHYFPSFFEQRISGSRLKYCSLFPPIGRNTACGAVARRGQGRDSAQPGRPAAAAGPGVSDGHV